MVARDRATSVATRVDVAVVPPEKKVRLLSGIMVIGLYVKISNVRVGIFFAVQGGQIV